MRETLVKTEEFKDSPVGRIPKDWETPTFEEVTVESAPICYGIVQPGSYVESGVPVVAIQNLNSDYQTNIHRSTQAIESRYIRSRIHHNDVLLSVKGTIGRVDIVPSWFSGNISRDVARIRLKPCTSPRYIRQMLLAPSSQKRLEQAVVGTTRAEISIGILKQLRLPLPPLPEQEGIAEILDTMDEAIAHTSSLIAKLKQMEAGLLHDLLTRGLDENGELRDAIAHPEQFKPSPLERIPQDWLVVSVGECLARIEQGWSPDCESNSTPIGEWGVLKTTAVVWEGYQDFENKQLPSHLQPDPNYEVKPGEVLMTRAGPNSRVGVVALVRQTQGKLILSDKLYRLIPRDCIKPDFLAYTLSGNRTQRHLSTLKTGLAESQTNISQEIVRTLLIAVPTIQEQDRIISILDTHDTRIRTEEAYYDKLKLQKQGLMHDLLTGKVRVKI